MESKFLQLTEANGSFVQVIGKAGDGALRTQSGRQGATPPPKKFAPEAKWCIEVFGPQTKGRRRQHSGATLDACLDSAIKELSEFNESQKVEEAKPIEDPQAPNRRRRQPVPATEGETKE